MKIETNHAKVAGAASIGFTLVEVLVAMAIIGVVFMALYSGLAYGFSTIRLARENQRATQILVEMMETVRLYSWEQINDDKFIPNKFTTTYAPADTAKSTGVEYEGTVSIDDVKNMTNYDDNMKQVTISLTWTTGKIKRTRSISTYVSQFGLHNYVY